MALATIPETTEPVELTSGIDALYLSGRGELPRSFLDELDRLKTLALDTGEAQDWQLGGYPVSVKAGNLKMYRYAVKHELGLFGFTPSETLPAVRVQPTSAALHSLGPELTVLWAQNVLDAAGLDVTFSVSRLDLHSDWQGLWVDADERRNFVTYSDKRALYEEADELSGLNFGKRGGALYARIYDKTRQAADKGDDWWPDVWGNRYDPEQRVLRVEFEFTRDGLRDFGVNTPDDAFAQVGPLWAYATGKWLSLRLPNSDETRSRWPLDPRWSAIQRATIANNSVPADRIRAGQTAGSLRKLMPALVGYLAGAAVHLGTKDAPSTVAALLPHIDAYGQRTGVSFAARRDEKARKQ